MEKQSENNYEFVSKQFVIDGKIMTVKEGVTTFEFNVSEYCRNEYAVNGINLMSTKLFETVEVIVFPSSVIKLKCNFNTSFFNNLKIIDCSKSNQLKSIDKESFKGIDSDDIEIILPDSVEVFERHSFYGKLLRRVDWSFKSTTLGEGCFEDVYVDSIKLKVTEGAMTIKQGAFKRSSVTEVTLEALDQFSMEGNCFSYCDNLRAVTFKCDLKVLPKNTFNKCTSLERVVLPESLKTIKRQAFEYCIDLKLLVLPDSVEEIDENAFTNCCDELIIRFVGKEWRLPDFVEMLKEKQGSLREHALADSTHSREVTKNFTVKESCLKINENIEKFSDMVYADATVSVESITTLIIPDTLRMLEVEFGNFINLNQVKISKNSNLEVIADRCFKDCEKLKEFDFPKSIKSIGVSAFKNSGLKKLIIETEELALGECCFSFCRELKSVVIRATNDDCVFVFGWGCFQSCEALVEATFDCNSSVLPQYFLCPVTDLKFLKLPETLRLIGLKSIEVSNSLKFLKIPDSVVRIQDDNLFCYMQDNLVIEYLGLLWDKNIFAQLVKGHEEQLERYGIKDIDNNYGYYSKFANMKFESVPEVDEYVTLLPITLEDYARTLYPEEFIVKCGQEANEDEIEETSLF